MDNKVLTCNIINIPLYAVHKKNFCRIFLLRFGKPQMGNPPYLVVPPYTLEYKDPGP